MASRLTDLGYSATERVYRSVTSHMPDTSGYVRNAVRNRLVSMVTLNWIHVTTQVPNQDSDDPQLSGNDSDNKRIKNSGWRGNFDRLMEILIPFVEKFVIACKNFLTNSSNKDKSVIGFAGLAFVICTAIFSILLIALLFGLVQIAVITTAVGGVVIVVGSVALLTILCMVGMLLTMLNGK